MRTLTLLRRILIPLTILLAAFAIGGAVFAAANTVPASSAGEGSSVVSGYTITAIAYTLNAADPRNIDLVTYTATANNGSVAAVLTNMKTKFDSIGGSWYTCTRLGGVPPAHNLSCVTTAPQLTVLATNIFDTVITE
jgi:hypothetical protein